MTITMEGKTYKLFPVGWLNCTVVLFEDKGLMSFKPGEDPKHKIIVYFKPEGAKIGETITVLCTLSRHPDATFRKICVAALNGYVPEVGEDIEALLMGKPLKVKNAHRVSPKDNLNYNQAKDFAPPDPPPAGTKPPATKRLTGRGIKMAADKGSDAQLSEDAQITDEDVPF